MIYRIGHIIVALLLFISSTGIVLNRHYCRNQLKSMALFVKAEPCHHEKTMAACPMHSPTDPGDDQDSKNCCDDEAEYVKSDLDQITTSSEVELSFYPDLFSVHSFTFDIELPSVDKQSIQYLNYKPPLLVCDLPVRLQTFLC